jgi:ABC-type branched-subunit amino acid transport system ATPase component/branched-subunit amino acid ABC-type transport system permease component
VLSDFMPFVISGLTVGAIYGLGGTGLVITYKTSGIFNFAQPAMAAVAAYLFWYLHFDNITPGPQLDWPLAAAITVLVAGPIMGLGMEILARHLAAVATELQVLATIGLSLSIVGALGLLYMDEGALPYDQFLPTENVKLFGTFVGYDQIILFSVALAAVVILYFFFRFTRAGTEMRAVVDNPPLLDAMGTNPNSVRRSAWIIGAVFAAMSGVLLGPILATLNAGSFLTIIISSFGAAAIGAFSSLPLTFVGGLAIGVLGDVSQKYVGDVSWLAGLRGALPFIVLFVVLVVTKPSKLEEKRVLPPKPIKPSYYAPPKVRIVFAVLAIGFLALIPNIVATELSVWLYGLTFMALFLSLGLLVKLSGQVSLCHTALAAIGGATLAHAANDWGLPWLFAILAAGLITAAVGLIIAIPAIRMSGVFLALATFGFGLFLQQMIYGTSLMFGAAYSGLSVPRPSFAQGDTAFYYVVLAFVVVIAGFMVLIDYGRLGRLARALGDSKLALNTVGTNVTMTLVAVFAISAFIAGIAGALYASASNAVGLTAPMYIPLTSLQFFAVVLLIGLGTPWYGLAGALALQIGPYYIDKWVDLGDLAPYLSLLFGVGAIATALTSDRRPTVPQFAVNFFERFRKAPPAIDVAASAARPRPEGTGLEIRELTVRYGGFLAVDSLSIDAPLGRITGLLGPNGAGKTTTFNACSGLTRPSNGAVIYNGRDISRSNQPARARRGLGRTFQRVELWSSLTVEENIALGREGSMAGASLAKQLLAAPGQPKQIEEATAQALQLTGTGDIARKLVTDLSTGEKRRVELARVLAGPFDLLLLDEPSSGLDTSETERFGALLRDVVDARGSGILLVEHDMGLVTQVCDYIYVMDFGLKIFEGTPAEVMSSEIVRTAYLGTEPIEVAGAAVEPAG